MDSNQSIDSILGKRYQFELFEYFEGCVETYNRESKVVQKLMEIKARLYRLKQDIFKVMSSKSRLREVFGVMKSGKGIQNELDGTAKMSKTFPTKKDYLGSIKGMFFLHYSYGINLSKAVLDGTLSYKDHTRIDKSYPVSLDLHAFCHYFFRLFCIKLGLLTQSLSRRQKICTMLV